MLRRFNSASCSSRLPAITTATTTSHTLLKQQMNFFSAGRVSRFNNNNNSNNITNSSASMYEFGSTLQHNIELDVLDEENVFASSSTTSPLLSTTTTKNSLLLQQQQQHYSKNVHIISTIGPASAKEQVLKDMIISGMNICRLNFSHGTHEYHEANINLIRNVIRENFEQCHVAIALDTKGPEIRTGSFAEIPQGTATKINFEIGQNVKVTNLPKYRDKMTRDLLFIDYPNLIPKKRAASYSSGNNSKKKMMNMNQHQQNNQSNNNEVKRILIADGVLELKVVSISPDSSFLNCVVVSEASIGSKSNVNLPSIETDLPAISEKDMKDLEFAAKMNIDMVFASFTRSAFHIRMIRELLRSNGSEAAIIAKIENHEGVNNIDEILDAADGIMVARGDLGVEIPAERVFLAQKKIISHCNVAGKPAIVATQMLESMTKNPRATRAEIADVANAVLDGSDVVMLSAESAAGMYPVRAVQTLSRTSETAFSYFQHQKMLAQMIAMGSSHNNSNSNNKDTSSVIASTAAAAVLLSHQNQARAIVTVTRSGRSVHELRKYSPSVPIIAVCETEQRARKLNLVRGVIPLYFDGIEYEKFDELISRAIDLFSSSSSLTNAEDSDSSSSMFPASKWIGLTFQKGDFIVVSCTDSKQIQQSEESDQQQQQQQQSQEKSTTTNSDDENNSSSVKSKLASSSSFASYETFVKIIKL